MSQYGDGDYCSVWEGRWVTSARKEHPQQSSVTE